MRPMKMHGLPARPSNSDYHLFRPTVVRTPAGPLRLYTKPGIFSWRKPDRAAQMLLSTLAKDGVPAGSRLLDLGCGNGVIGFGAGLIQPNVELHLADASYAAVTAVSFSLDRLGLPGRVWHSDVGADLPAGLTVDVVVAHLPRGRDLGEEFIRVAWERLEPGGRFYLAGAKQTGIVTRVATTGEWFGNVEMVATTANYRVARALKRPGSAPPPPSTYHQYTVSQFQARERRWEYVSKPGVFGRKGLDGGTKRLLAHLEVRSGERVLDLGCGAGMVGLVCSGLTDLEGVVMVDDSLPAVRAAQRTIEHNRLPRAVARLSDAGSAVIGERFDVVATNPPFHLGSDVEFDTARQFVEDSRDVLGTKGRLYLVGNSFLSHDQVMEGMFRRVDEIHRDRFFRVLLGARPVGRVKGRPLPPLVTEP